jgi:hypothetical protein
VALIRTDFYESVPIQELTTSLCNLLALVHPEDGGATILRNVGSYKSHTVSSSYILVEIFQLVLEGHPTYLPTYLWFYSPCGPWPFFGFLIYTQSVGLLGRGISPVARPLPTHRTNAHRHPWSQCWSGRRRFVPYTARPLWSADHRTIQAKNLRDWCSYVNQSFFGWVGGRVLGTTSIHTVVFVYHLFLLDICSSDLNTSFFEECETHPI